MTSAVENAVRAGPTRWADRVSRRCRRSRSTSTCRGACASARIAISIRTRREAISPRSATSRRSSPTSTRRCRSCGDAASTRFFGGGTPSLFSAHSIDTILSGRARARAAGGRRRNHARSESRHVRSGKIRGVPRRRREPPVDRHPELQPAASQSARAHTRRRQARRAIEIAREHFDNFNLDLMYALPGQTADGARRTSRGARRSSRRTFRSIT